MANLRKCIGSTRFGIEAHEAPLADFPVQPSQKDGLGRMCKPHWNQYTTGLSRDAKARKTAGGVVSAEAVRIEPDPTVAVAPNEARGRKAREAGVAKTEPMQTRAPRPAQGGKAHRR